MQNFADIHTHILPGVDDGAAGLDESLALIDKAYDDGVRMIVVTPHCGKVRLYHDEAEINRRFEELKRACAEDTRYAEKFSDLRLFLGSELHVTPDMCRGLVEELQEHPAMRLAGKQFVLVELPMNISFNDIKYVVQVFTRSGYWPIIAHAERYGCLRPGVGKLVPVIEKVFGVISAKRFKGDKLTELVDLGAYIQFNAECIIDEDMWCLEMLEKGNVHFIASDCHDLQHRPPNIGLARDTVSRLLGEEEASFMFSRFMQNAHDLLGLDY